MRQFGESRSFAFASAGTVVLCRAADLGERVRGRTVYEIMLAVERVSTGVRSPWPKAVSVTGPKDPIDSKPRERWNRVSADLVDAPKWPSTSSRRG